MATKKSAPKKAKKSTAKSAAKKAPEKQEEVAAPVEQEQDFYDQTPHDNDYHEDELAPEVHPDAEVSWEASEYIHHEKSMSWYFGLLGVAILFGAALYLITDDISSVGGISSFVVLIVMTAAIMVYAGRKPETLKYHLDTFALKVGEREFVLDDFRSFSLIEDGGVISIQLMPLKRFSPAVSIYYDPKDEEKIVSILASYLPHEEMELDLVDRLIRKVRF